MFSKSCEYALRATIYLARHSADDRNISLKEIAKEINAPEYFCAKILQQLTREGLIQSIKGPNGGFYLDEQNKQGNLANIVEAIDGDHVFADCALGLKECSSKNPCPLHEEFALLRNKIYHTMSNAQLQLFIKQEEPVWLKG